MAGSDAFWLANLVALATNLAGQIRRFPGRSGYPGGCSWNGAGGASQHSRMRFMKCQNVR